MVWRCVPILSNGHSYRQTDPFNFTQVAPGEDDTVLARVEGTLCVQAYPWHASLSRGERASFDPMSPTQVPINYSLIRGNREHFFHRSNKGANHSHG